jgi:hypothetical protein
MGVENVVPPEKHVQVVERSSSVNISQTTKPSLDNSISESGFETTTTSSFPTNNLHINAEASSCTNEESQTEEQENKPLLDSSKESSHIREASTMKETDNYQTCTEGSAVSHEAILESDGESKEEVVQLQQELEDRALKRREREMEERRERLREERAARAAKERKDRLQRQREERFDRRERASPSTAKDTPPLPQRRVHQMKS